MNKGLRPVMLLVTAFMAAIILSSCGGSNTLTVDKVDIIAELLPDGDLYVEELYTYTVSGEYEWITRPMDNFGDANIEFFEAYVPPSDRKLGNFGYIQLERYPASLREKSGSYYIKVLAKDETRQVYYRYRLDKEAVKYDDRGELDWTILKDNDKDHHNVSVSLRMRQSIQEPVIAYVYDRSGGAVTENTNELLRYENKLLPSGDHARLKAYVPTEALSDLETTASSTLLSQQLKRETALSQKFAERERLMEAGIQLIRWLTYVAVAGVVYYALSLRRLAAWFGGKRISFEEIEDMDPGSLVYLYRKGALRRVDVLADLFKLRRKGMLDTSIELLGTRFQEDAKAPKQGPQFTFIGKRSGLAKSERYLLNWLFRGTGILKLDSLSGPTKTERKQKISEDMYMNRLRGLQRGFIRWRELVEDENRQTIKAGVYAPRKEIFPVLALLHLAMLVYLYIADVTAWGWVGLLFLIVGGSATLASIRWRKKKYIIGFLVVCFIAAAQIQYAPVVDTYLNFVLLSMVMVGLMPGKVLNRSSAAKRSAVKRYRRMLARGGDYGSREPEALERMIETAILLGIGRRFVIRVRNKQPDHDRISTLPLWDPASITALDYVFNQSWKGITRNSSTWSSGGDSGDGDGGFFGDSSDSGGDGGGDGGGGGGGD
ncbi:DUF2207 domain-containing protein [Paenibacillus solani]|uniref:DUF2207 domain-containing protein n=1 Tax=Paenibacillus solani TaxID=1705565 RepID=A0A0M1P254_9BACL|nr:DUF2207 domain-containing protein [Paenibacillus solani]KOR88556.1 hypothetical protein AM231_04910 [Paenibacillus solani]